MEKQLCMNLPTIQEDSIDQILVKNEGYHHQESYHDQHSNFRNKSEIKENKLKMEKQNKKKLRKNYDKWNDQEKKTYWFGLMAMVQQNPLVKHSWGNWKVDKCFKKMQKHFKGNKDNTQIKSFDQRMKNYYKIKNGIDLQEAICKALKELKLSTTEMKIIEKFQESRSDQKLFENEEAEKINRDLDRQIQNNERYKIQILNIIERLELGIKRQQRI